jgi:Ca2+-binding RTX toxin-like protein
VSYGHLVTTPVTVDLDETGPQPTGAGSQTITGIENIDGTSQDDTLIGNAGPNLLLAEGGKDVLERGPGDDDLEGAGGGATAVYAHAPAGVTVDLTAGTATGGDGNDTVHNVSNVVG